MRTLEWCIGSRIIASSDLWQVIELFICQQFFQLSSEALASIFKTPALAPEHVAEGAPGDVFESGTTVVRATVRDEVGTVMNVAEVSTDEGIFDVDALERDMGPRVCDSDNELVDV